MHRRRANGERMASRDLLDPVHVTSNVNRSKKLGVTGHRGGEGEGGITSLPLQSKSFSKVQSALISPISPRVAASTVSLNFAIFTESLL